MTETATPPAPRLLYRDPGEGMFAGVCAAIGRYTDTDPVIWRIITVVLAVFGGAGLVLYLIGWLLIPKVGEGRSLAESWINRDHNLSGKALVLLGILALVILGSLGDGRGAVAIAVLAVVGYLVYRERQVHPTVPAAYAAPAVSAEGEPIPWTPPPPPPKLPRERSRLGLATISVAAVVSGALIWARLAGADALTPARIIAVALLVVGAGLVVGTWWGRARWLTPVGLVLCLALATAVAADSTGATLHGGVGDRSWVVNAVQPHQDFRLGVGEATLDLSALPPTGKHLAVTAHVGLGHLIVVVPDGVAVQVHAKARMGDITEYGRTLVDGTSHVERTLSYGPPGGPRVEVEASVGTGQVEVRRG